MIFLELLWTFFKIGAFTFGGGYAMLPLIQEEVLSHDWVDEATLIDFIAVSESTPGPFAINMATYIGSERGGMFGVFGSVFGAFCATLGVVLPSFIIILIVAKCYEKFKENKVVRGCMSGLKPAVVGLIGAAFLSVVSTVFVPTGFTWAIFSDVWFYFSLAIFALCAVLAFRKLHPIVVIGVSAVLGIAGGYLIPQ